MLAGACLCQCGDWKEQTQERRQDDVQSAVSDGLAGKGALAPTGIEQAMLIVVAHPTIIPPTGSQRRPMGFRLAALTCGSTGAGLGVEHGCVTR